MIGRRRSQPPPPTQAEQLARLLTTTTSQLDQHTAARQQAQTDWASVVCATWNAQPLDHHHTTTQELQIMINIRRTIATTIAVAALAAGSLLATSSPAQADQGACRIHTSHSVEKRHEGAVAYAQQHKGASRVLPQRNVRTRYLGMSLRPCFGATVAPGVRSDGGQLWAIRSEIGAGWHILSASDPDQREVRQAYKLTFTDGNAADRRATYVGLVTRRQAERNAWPHVGRLEGADTPQAGLVYAWR